LGQQIFAGPVGYRRESFPGLRLLRLNTGAGEHAARLILHTPGDLAGIHLPLCKRSIQQQHNAQKQAHLTDPFSATFSLSRRMLGQAFRLHRPRLTAVHALQ
jgi:hypothetical protein